MFLATAVLGVYKATAVLVILAVGGQYTAQDVSALLR